MVMLAEPELVAVDVMSAVADMMADQVEDPTVDTREETLHQLSMDLVALQMVIIQQ